MIGSAPDNAALALAQLLAAEPLEWRVRWNWNWPPWVTVCAIVTSILWVMAIYFRETSSAGRAMRTLLGLLRLTALALALLMFAQPVLEWFRLGRPRLVLLVDRSASMGTVDRFAEATAETTRLVSRLEAWQTLLTDGQPSLLDHWQSDYQLEVVAFDERIDRIDAADAPLAEQLLGLRPTDGATSGTRLGDAVDTALRELPGPPPVAIVVLSDGVSTRGQPLQRAADRARRLRVPLYTVAVGGDGRRPDIAVENLMVEESVFPGDRLQVEATVRAVGYGERMVEAVLRDRRAARELARTTLELLDDEQAQTIRLAICPTEAGQLALELAIEPLEEEANADNNSARQMVEVSDKKIRVLLLQAQPSYEYRALKSLLERDPAVELRVRLQEADADYSAIDETALRSFPASEAELFTYDVLLLGDADPGLLPRSVWPLVERFVTDHGGGMVGIAGPRFMPSSYRGIRPLELLLPIEIDSLNPLRWQIGGTETFAVVPTALGWRTPSLQLGATIAESQQIWSALPPVAWVLRAGAVKPGAEVLAECPGLTNRPGQSLPIILRHYVGAGEVLFHATDETWRWRWRTDDRYFARYWGQVVRRLGRGRLAVGRQGVQFNADRSFYDPGEPVQLLVRFRNPAQAPAEDDQVIVQLQGSMQPSRQIVLQRRSDRRGLFTAIVENLAPGQYEAILVRPHREEPTDAARFEIRQPPQELSQLAVNRQGLKLSAELSGGKAYTVATAPQLRQDLPSPLRQTVDELPPRQLWNSHAMIGLFVVVLTSEWLLRCHHGML